MADAGGSWSNGWYAAEGTVALEQVSVSGDVHLILVTGADLTVSGGILVQSGGSRLEQPLVVTDMEIERTEKCDAPGTTTYTAQAVIGGKSQRYAITLEDVPPAGHQWSSEPTVSWSDDMRTVTFTLTCTRDATHTVAVTAHTTATTLTAPTCETAGEARYTATAQMTDGKTVTAETTAPAAALGHAWCFGANDPYPPRLERVDGVLTATLTCRNDPGHTWTTTELQRTSAGQVKAATCTAEGGELIRITLTVDGKTHVLGEEVIDTTPASGHQWGKWTTLSETSSKMVRERTCSVCGQAERIDFTAAGGAWKAIGHNKNLRYIWRHGEAGVSYQFTVRPCTVKGATKALFGAGYNTSKSVTFPG